MPRLSRSAAVVCCGTPPPPRTCSSAPSWAALPALPESWERGQVCGRGVLQLVLSFRSKGLHLRVLRPGLQELPQLGSAPDDPHGREALAVSTSACASPSCTEGPPKHPFQSSSEVRLEPAPGVAALFEHALESPAPRGRVLVWVWGK